MTHKSALTLARDALTQMIACHDEPACAALDTAREALAAIEAALVEDANAEQLADSIVMSALTQAKLSDAIVDIAMSKRYAMHDTALQEYADLSQEMGLYDEPAAPSLPLDLLSALDRLYEQGFMPDELGPMWEAFRAQQGGQG